MNIRILGINKNIEPYNTEFRRDVPIYRLLDILTLDTRHDSVSA